MQIRTFIQALSLTTAERVSSLEQMDLKALIVKLIGTLAVILLVAAFLGSRELFSRWISSRKSWKYVVFSGVLGGVFGIYGNLSGMPLGEAVISVRDIGPMLAGYTGGPVAGVIAGLIAGLHRLYLGGITAPPCVVATFCIGLVSGLICRKHRKVIQKPYFAALLSAALEAFHLCVVLVMVKPFELAVAGVKQIAVPFILINAVGFMLMVSISVYADKQRKLAIENSRIQSELEVANVIQHSLLPLISESYPGRSETDVAAFMQAAKEVGGDFYDVFFVDQNRLAFVIGDVSGKGVPAAIFMAASKITLQNCLRDLDLSSSISAANNALCARNEAEMFLTAWVGVLDLTTFELTFVSAGHNPPVLVRDGNAELLKTRNGFVLAGMEDVKYREKTVQLKKGDAVLLYTDGVTEAQNTEGELYGEERLLSSLTGVGEATAGALIEAAKNGTEAFVGRADQFDDMTMLCFRLQ